MQRSMKSCSSSSSPGCGIGILLPAHYLQPAPFGPVHQNHLPRLAFLIEEDNPFRRRWREFHFTFATGKWRGWESNPRGPGNGPGQVASNLPASLRLV